MTWKYFGQILKKSKICKQIGFWPKINITSNNIGIVFLDCLYWTSFYNDKQTVFPFHVTDIKYLKHHIYIDVKYTLEIYIDVKYLHRLDVIYIDV